MHLSHIRIVLVQTTHPGNIGSAARAMKTMGLERLYLVQPKIFPHEDSTALAAGADDILERAVRCESLAEALGDCHWVLGTSARVRELPLHELDPREAAEFIFSKSELGASTQPEIAIVFGREHAGLTNDELLACQRHIIIPANPDYSSLNLAQAVQVICYELQMASLSAMKNIARAEPRNASESKQTISLATQHELNLLYEHLERMLIAVEFLNPKAPKRLMPRLKRLFNRAEPEKLEVDLLRGLCTAVEKHVKDPLVNQREIE